MTFIIKIFKKGKKAITKKYPKFRDAVEAMKEVARNGYRVTIKLSGLNTITVIHPIQVHHNIKKERLNN